MTTVLARTGRKSRLWTWLREQVRPLFSKIYPCSGDETGTTKFRRKVCLHTFATKNRNSYHVLPKKAIQAWGKQFHTYFAFVEIIADMAPHLYRLEPSGEARKSHYFVELSPPGTMVKLSQTEAFLTTSPPREDLINAPLYIRTEAPFLLKMPLILCSG